MPVRPVRESNALGTILRRSAWAVLVVAAAGCATMDRAGQESRSAALGPIDERTSSEWLAQTGSDTVWFTQHYAGRVLAVTGEVESRQTSRDGRIAVRFRDLRNPERQVIARLNTSAWTPATLEQVRLYSRVELICRGGTGGNVILLEDCEPSCWPSASATSPAQRLCAGSERPTSGERSE